MKVLLHIGQSKTGTSAIQAFLTLNRKVLREAGILYPAVKVGGTSLDLGAHNAVADALLDLSRFPHLSADEYFRQFFEEAEAADAKLLILSAEHFFGGEPRIWESRDAQHYFDVYRRKISRLSGYLGGHEVQVLLYLRPQIDWLASAVGQTVRINRLISENRIYEDDGQFFALVKPLLEYSKLTDAWQEILRPSSFMVVPYSRKTLHANSSIADFLKRAGLDAIHFPFAGADIQVNESLTREYLEVKKILNTRPHGKNTERVMIRCLERLSAQSDQTTQYTLAPDVEEEVERLARSDNEYLNAKYGSDTLVFNSRSAALARKPAPLTPGDVNRALATFEREFHSPRAKLLSLNFATRAFLRNHAKPVQGVLHTMKMAYLRMKYRNA